LDVLTLHIDLGTEFSYLLLVLGLEILGPVHLVVELLLVLVIEGLDLFF
jgi:hypothetical protein